jgi:hypothetical protein
MALTAAQKFSLFEILEVPFGTTGNEMSEDGLTRTQKTVADAWSAKVAIEAHLLTVTADGETRLVAHITAWDALGYSTAKLQGGQVGAVGNADYDPNQKRAIILERVKVIVPFYRAHEWVGAPSGGDAMSIEILR